MKKSIKTMLALMAGTIAFTACSNDDEFENITEQAPLLKPMTFTAIQEGQDGASRAEIDDVSIKWTEGDKISIFDGVIAGENFDHTFTLTEGIGKTSGTFDGEAAEAATYYALYPCVSSRCYEGLGTVDAQYVCDQFDEQFKEQDIHWNIEFFQSLSSQWQTVKNSYALDDYLDIIKKSQVGEGLNLLNDEQMALVKAYLTQEKTMRTLYEGVLQNGGVFTGITIPAEQTATAGSADPKAMLMIGTSDDTNNIQFKNICAYVKVTPKFDCSAIAIRSNGTENLAGTVTVDYNSGAPTTTVTADGKNEVILTGEIKANSSYYIAVRPETLSSGFTIEFLTADNGHYYARTANRNFGLARNKLIDLGTFDATSTWTINTPTTGDDGKGHTWYLVTPTLKLASTDAGKEAYTSASGLWGDDWVIPSQEDMQPIVDAKASSWKSTTKTATIKGNGILRNLSYAITINNTIPNVWLSTQYSSSRQYLMNFNANNNTSSAATGTSTPILYKYTK